jgi:hypothetical protein
MDSFSAAVQRRRRCGPSRTSNFEEEPVIGLTLLLSLSEVGDRVRSIRGLLQSAGQGPKQIQNGAICTKEICSFSTQLAKPLCMTCRVFFLWVAWLLLCATAVVIIEPIELRPISGSLVNLERFSAFTVVWAAFCLGYPKRRLCIFVLLFGIVGILGRPEYCPRPSWTSSRQSRKAIWCSRWSLSSRSRGAVRAPHRAILRNCSSRLLGNGDIPLQIVPKVFSASVRERCLPRHLT